MNRPKYLSSREIYSHLSHPKLSSTELKLTQEAIELLEKADMFYISSANRNLDMDLNHRGGPPGFLRILSNDETSLTLIYPEYSGNRFYQTLGNLRINPRAGLVFPDFETGNVLYATGKTEILYGEAVSSLLPHTNLAVKISVEALRFVTDGLAFRGRGADCSPYNPQVRYLVTERPKGVVGAEKKMRVKLIQKEILTPHIGRYHFQLINPEKPGRSKPGQYAAMCFIDEFDLGYSHMRDEDPLSLNDDYVRTFTVSSGQDALPENEFELTIRNVGKVSGLKLRLRDLCIPKGSQL